MRERRIRRLMGSFRVVWAVCDSMTPDGPLCESALEQGSEVFRDRLSSASA